MASSLQGVNTILTWADFQTVSVPAPTPGGPSVSAAQTRTRVGLHWAWETAIAAGRQVFQVRDTIQVTVAKVSAPRGARGAGDFCWKADWLSTLPQSEQDALLIHEQGHYKIAALLGRDLFNELQHLASPPPNQYDTQSDLQAAVDAIVNRFSAAVIQRVEARYDAVTHHDPVHYANEQATWNRYFTSAFGGTPLLDVLAANNVTI